MNFTEKGSLLNVSNKLDSYNIAETKSSSNTFRSPSVSILTENELDFIIHLVPLGLNYKVEMNLNSAQED
jgi:hypothetical protein